MKKCPMCGNENDDIAKACINCGTRLEVSPKLAINPNAIYGKTPKRQRTQEEMMEGLVQLTYGIANDVSAIKGWVTFLGVLALIGLIFGLISSCGALLGL